MSPIIAGILMFLPVISNAGQDAQTSVNFSEAYQTLQWLIDGLFAVLAILVGWVLNSLQKSLKGLQDADSILMDKVHSIDVLVAGEYVRKTELDKLSEALFAKLDRIERKLDSKVDKI